MVKRRTIILSLACIALMGTIATEARSELISMSISVGGGPPILIDGFATPPTPTATSWSSAGADLVALNGVLAAMGSEYQFVTLGGSSNFPGSFLGNLVLTGEIHSSTMFAGGSPLLTLVETETGFTSPSTGTGALKSTSTGNFTLEPAGTGHSASSTFNATSTPTYDVHSSGLLANGETNSATVGLGDIAGAIPYTLTNTISFDLSPATVSDVVDSFSVTADVGAGAIPEPASIFTFLMGLPLPLVAACLLARRRRRAAAAAG